MPSKTKLMNAAIAANTAALPKMPKELFDKFVTGLMSGEAVNAAYMSFKKVLIERAMGAELCKHLGYPAGATKPESAANQRNGTSGKSVLTGEGQVRIEVPRERNGSFELILIAKHKRRFTGFDHNIIAMYARGMTMREIQGFLLESYGTDVSDEFISSMTEPVTAEVTS
jgi:transposase-like protein